MTNLAIITARSGSKGIKDKNIRPLLDKPLLAYSIIAAKESALFDEIMVSTDSKYYADISKAFGASVPFLRSASTSTDGASSWDVVREVLDNYKKIGKTFDTICLLQPTSPLRTSEDIIGAYSVFQKKKANAVFSVCEADHSPLWMNTLPDDLSMDHFERSPDVGRQFLPTFYRINGAIYIVSVPVVLSNTNLYDHSFAYIMPNDRSVDIDTEFDFEMANFLLARQHK